MKKRIWSKTDYNLQWSSFIKSMQEYLKKENNVLNMLHKIRSENIGRSFSNKTFFDIHRRLGLKVQQNTFPSEVLTVLDNKYVISPINSVGNDNFYDIVVDFIKDQGQNINSIIELGSGTGINLISIAERIDSGLRERIKFYSCEFTSSGREASSLLNKAYGKINLSTEYFNYYQPDLTFLDGKKNNLFLSVHSIEQIPNLSKEVFKEMIRVSNKCFCIHAEPIGWQNDDQLRNKRLQYEKSILLHVKADIKDFFNKADSVCYLKFGKSFLDESKRYGIEIEQDDIGNSDRVNSNAAKYSSIKGYNSNLLQILNEMAGKGSINIDVKKFNSYAVNPLNPTTIIKWSKTS